MNTLPEVTVVVPAFNEAASLPELLCEIEAALDTLGLTYEIVVVDDGSDDDTAEIVKSHHDEDSRIGVIKLARNYGKSAGYMAGFAAARGAIVVTVDADLQDDPAEIGLMLQQLQDGHDLVVGWKHNRFVNEPHKTIPSRLFNALIKLLFGLELHDSNSGFRVMTRRVARSLSLHGDLYRFIPELAHMNGHRVVEVPVKHRRRKHGRSKYGPRRFITGLLDLLTVRFLTKYSDRPLHFFGGIALIPLLVGMTLELYVLAMKFGGDTFQTHVAAIIIGVMFLLAASQSILVGLIGEMLTAQQERVRFLVEWESLPDHKSRIAAAPKADAATGQGGDRMSRPVF